MTVATDLQLQHGPRRRLFLRIAGLQPNLWEPSGEESWEDFWSEEMATEDWSEDNPNGYSITAASGSLVMVTTGSPEWMAGPHTGPIAYYSLPTIPVGRTRVRYYARLASCSAPGAAQTAIGMTVFSDRDNAYLWEIGWYAGDSRGPLYFRLYRLVANAWAYRWDGWGGAALAGTTESHLAIERDITSGAISFLWSRDGVSWTTAYSETCAITPTSVGTFIRSPFGIGVTASWDYIRAAVPQLQCLRAPEEEWSQGLDLGTLEVAPSSMMLELDDIEDPGARGTSYFGKLFAPGRYLQGARTRLDESETRDVVLATDTTIPAMSTAGFSAPGWAHIGQECFSYTGLTGGGAASFTGCARGLYPAVLALGTWAGTYRQPLPEDIGGRKPITQYPYTMNGRMVALYVVTWDVTAGTWHPETDAELLWVGRITGAAKYNPKRAAWQLGCESIAKDLEREVGGDLRSGDLHKINLSGSVGRSFTCYEYGRRWHVEAGVSVPLDGVEVAEAYITIDAGFYDREELLKIIIDKLNLASSWTNVNPTYPRRLMYGKGIVDGLSTLTVINMWADGNREFKLLANGRDGAPCHAWRALGYSTCLTGAMQTVLVKEGSGGAKQEELFAPGERPFDAYHPLDLRVNGNKMAVARALNNLWADQGDYGTPRACVVIASGVCANGYIGDDPSGVWVVEYSGIDESDPRVTALTLMGASWPGAAVGLGHVGQRAGDPVVKVEQRYIPACILSDGTERGPFELLLPSLLSTGTPGHNGSYDVLPVGVGLGFPLALIDTENFVDADKTLGSTDLSRRPRYVIEPATAWATLLHREGQLFGFFLAWDRGKLRLKNGRAESFSAWTVTLDESARADEREWVTPESSPDTVINTWHYKLDYDLAEKKYMREITIRDADSCEGLQVTKSVELEHPGICIDARSEADSLEALIETQLIAAQQVLRVPWQVVDVTLAPPCARQIAIGDVVLYESTRHPDPFGSGSMTTACLALVIDFAQSFRRWTGRAKLLVCARPTVLPWAPSAVVDFSASNGGWDAANHRLTLTARTYGEAVDDKDGDAFEAGDRVMLLELAPFDDRAAQEWGPLVVDKDFEEDGADLLTLAAGTTLSGWPGGSAASGREFVVTFSDYSDAVILQRARGTWQADGRDRAFGDGDPAEVWG